MYNVSINKYPCKKCLVLTTCDRICKKCAKALRHKDYLYIQLRKQSCPRCDSELIHDIMKDNIHCSTCKWIISQNTYMYLLNL